MPVPDFKQSRCLQCFTPFRLRLVEIHSETSGTYEGTCPTCGKELTVHTASFLGNTPVDQSKWREVLEGSARAYGLPPLTNTPVYDLPIQCPHCGLDGKAMATLRGVTFQIRCPRCDKYYPVTIPGGNA